MPLPKIQLQVLPKNRVCIGETVTLKGSGAKWYKWFAPDSMVYAAQEIGFATGMQHSGTYTLVGTDLNGCSDRLTTTVFVNALPTGSLQGRPGGCVPFCADYRLQPVPGKNTVLSTWQIKGRSYKEKFNYCFDEAGTYPITGLLQDTATGCQARIESLVMVYERPVADFTYTPEQPVEKLDEVYFSNTSQGEEQVQWRWFVHLPDAGEKKGEMMSQVFPDPGQYLVALVVENTWGCRDTTVKALKVEEDFHLYVPNIFTPNGDRDNDLFLPIGSGIRLYTLRIFNRWGAQVFESHNLAEGWDGSYGAEKVPVGVYAWKIDVSGTLGERKQMSGHVTLLR
jgi:gliding motility-associated-like protein